MVALAAGACTLEPAGSAAEWRGHVLHEVRSVRELPEFLKVDLEVDRPGMDGVADRGRPFNPTDVIDESLPMRRFVVAGHDDDIWIVELEHGGYSYRVEVFLFVAQEPTARETWVFFEQADTLAELVRQISRSSEAR